MITRKNYELYFIDYLEESLSDEDRAMVDIFLEENLDLKEELEEFSFSPLEEPIAKEELDFSYLKKDSLIDESNEEDFFIGKIEGDLNKEQLHFLDLYLKANPEKASILASFERTKLTPEVLMFPNKKSLKKTRKIGFYYYLTSGVAACILLMLYLNLNMNGTNESALAAQKNQYDITLDELVKENIDKGQSVELKQQEVVLPTYNKPENLAQQNEEIEPAVPVENNKKVPKFNKAIELEIYEQKNINIVVKEKNPELLAIAPVQELIIPDDTKQESKTVKEFATDKSISFIKEKTTGKKDESQSVLAFAEIKVKEISLPDFIEYDNQKSEKQQVRTIKVGNLFSIKRRTKI